MDAVVARLNAPEENNMSTLQLDKALRERLNGLTEQLAVCDEAGKTVGYFVPDELYKRMAYAWMESQTNDDELNAIRDEPGGRSLQEIWKSLGRTRISS